MNRLASSLLDMLYPLDGRAAHYSRVSYQHIVANDSR